MNRLEDNKEILNGIQKEHGFNVPDGYFDGLAHKIQERCVQETKIPEKVGIMRVLRPQLAFVSLIVIFAALTYSVFTIVLPNNDSIKRGLSAIELDIEDFEYLDIEEDIIVDAIISQDDTIQSKEEPKQEISDEMLHYLIENNADFTTLFEEY